MTFYRKHFPSSLRLHCKKKSGLKSGLGLENPVQSGNFQDFNTTDLIPDSLRIEILPLDLHP